MSNQTMWQELVLNSVAEPIDSTLIACPLDKQALLQFSGPDSEKFLQGQLSCDLNEVTSIGSRLAAHCNPKGSMHSIMRVVHYKDSFLLRCNLPNIEYTQENLSKYMMFSKAQCNNLQESWLGLGLSGTDAAPFLLTHFDSIPEETDQTAFSSDYVIIKTPGERFELWMPFSKMSELIKSLDGKFATSDNWYKQDILQGIADIHPATREQFIPQMCNLQALNGVSFRKGCYTGQEVITRLHFRGKLTKQLCLAKTQHSANIAIGDTILNDQQSKIGRVIQRVKSGEWIYLQLVVNHKFIDQAFYLESGATVTAIELPYQLDPELFTRKL